MPVHVREPVSSGSPATLYVESEHPGSWADLEASCQASGGFLVSLSDPALERAVAGGTGLGSFWCGGNMCPDSPGRQC